ncbi:hypothetical protein AAI421_14630 [Rhodococcus aetherivorans]|uniref:hypothetical protein n=1 Tax=Rhodococcus aetherivorans TaxID=191292 RepID=UPI0031D81348
MSIRDELIETLASANRLSSLDFDTKCRLYGDKADAILARFGVVELPAGEQDDDGQTWFDDCEIRVDHTGRHGAEVYLNKRPVHPSWLRARAAEYLAAARDAEAQS